MPNLAALHDAESIAIAAPDTWAIDTVSLSDNPHPATYPDGVTWIARLNNGYGSTGTLPHPDQYNSFAQKVAAYVAGTRNCRRWIIGNEPSLRREWPDGVPIYPWHYAACFEICRDAIQDLPGHAHDEVLVAASGPWNDECKYEGNAKGDWITYFTDVLGLLQGGYDGYALHSYTHGYDVALVTSTARMDAPFQDRYYNFLAYRDYCDAIPPEYAHLPAYITEANGDGPWQAVGLMPAMLGEIDFWNRSNNTPLIHCVAFYRYPHYDQFYIEGRGDVIAEYKAAVAQGYRSPTPLPIPEPPTPEPPAPALDRYFDPALRARGVEIVTPSLRDGDTYWFAEHLEWLDEQESGGRHHIYGNCYDEDGLEIYGVKLKVSWPSGDHIIDTKPDAHSPYSYNYPMSKSLNEFRIEVLDGEYKSELVTGIGMGMAGNSGIHTSTVVKWALRTHSAIVKPPKPEPPIPEPGPVPPIRLTPLLWPVDGPISQYFGSHGIDYSHFGLPGHDGLDFAVAVGTPVIAPANGVVMWVDNDEAGFGLYIRLWHGDYGFHSLVAHLSQQLVKVGQLVERGQVIAKSGNTGNSTGPHCHYSCRLGERDSYYNLHDGYDKGCANPLAVYALLNRRDPNMSLGAM